ncbi:MULTISPECIES: cytochrome-c oxidase [Bacillaceae]|uniref:Cbb3-type cytochrome c oxidase subunit I n=1 Tax=Evansella alkalicola TaxID=745819 RepID=A0ABS6JZ73_9BACI|nr:MULTISPECIES: cytochrome-c oxidase [Bacillaceae]MBU9722984.1 cbb3-type cytochrome c oxidase subunit I [Bacillus alkalicola]
MGIQFIKISVVYFVIGVSLGLYMSMTHDYSLTGVHAQINLLGWTSMTLAGLIYFLFPKATEDILGKGHFVLHNIGLIIMMIALFSLIKTGNDALGPIVGIGGIILTIGVVLFAINVLKNVRPENFKLK